MNCPLCGGAGYAGLVTFECQGPGCRNNRSVIVEPERKIWQVPAALEPKLPGSWEACRRREEHRYEAGQVSVRLNGKEYRSRGSVNLQVGGPYIDEQQALQLAGQPVLSPGEIIEEAVRPFFGMPIADDDPNRILGRNVITPTTILNAIRAEMSRYVEQGWIDRDQIEDFKRELHVERDINDPRRVNIMRFPEQSFEIKFRR